MITYEDLLPDLHREQLLGETQIRDHRYDRELLAPALAIAAVKPARSGVEVAAAALGRARGRRRGRAPSTPSPRAPRAPEPPNAASPSCPDSPAITIAAAPAAAPRRGRGRRSRVPECPELRAGPMTPASPPRDRRRPAEAPHRAPGDADASMSDPAGRRALRLPVHTSDAVDEQPRARGQRATDAVGLSEPDVTRWCTRGWGSWLFAIPCPRWSTVSRVTSLAPPGDRSAPRPCGCG